MRVVIMSKIIGRKLWKVHIFHLPIHYIFIKFFIIIFFVILHFTYCIHMFLFVFNFFTSTTFTSIIFSCTIIFVSKWTEFDPNQNFLDFITIWGSSKIKYFLAQTNCPLPAWKMWMFKCLIHIPLNQNPTWDQFNLIPKLYLTDLKILN